MKRLFLASSADIVAGAIVKEINKKGLKLLFITTASEVEDGDLWWLDADRKALVEAGFEITDYTFTGKTKLQISEVLKNTDIIHIEGGNTFYLLEKIQQSGCAKVIRNYVENGKIYIGSSAGSIIAGPDIYPTYRIDEANKAPKLKGYTGLELVDFVVFPHWGSDFFKKSYLDKEVKHAYTTKNKIILLTDYQYINVKNNMYRIEEIKH